MKQYEGYRNESNELIVTVDRQALDPRLDLRMFCHWGFECGYGGVGASQLKAKDLELISTLTESAAISVLQKDLNTIEEQLKKAERGLKGKVDAQILDRCTELRKERRALLAEVAVYEELETLLSGTADELQRAFDERQPAPEDISPLAQELFVDVTKSWKMAIAASKASVVAVGRAKSESQAKILAWEKKVKFENAENAYKAEIKKKSALQEKEGIRNDLAERQKKQDSKLKKAQRAFQNSMEIRVRRQKLLEELGEISSAYSNERGQQAELITSRSGGKLHIVVKPQSDTTNYTQGLLKLKIGARAEKTEIEGLIQKIPATKLVNLVLDENVKQLSDEGGVSEQMASSSVSAEIELAHDSAWLGRTNSSMARSLRRAR